MAQVNNNNDIKYLTPIAVDTKRKKYCRFKKNRIKLLAIFYIEMFFVRTIAN